MKIFASALLLVLLASFTQPASLPRKTRFSAAEKSLIYARDTARTMRVWLITDKSDSLFLRRQCTDISPKSDKKVVAHLVARMLRTVHDSMTMGVGIAAPQVGVGRNLVLVQRFDKTGFPFEAYLNPRILVYSPEKQPCKEGCLSIPDTQGETQTRALTITIGYDDLRGKHHEESVTGFTAVIFQHEIDHLNGILFTDHLKAEAAGKK